MSCFCTYSGKGSVVEDRYHKRRDLSTGLTDRGFPAGAFKPTFAGMTDLIPKQAVVVTDWH